VPWNFPSYALSCPLAAILLQPVDVIVAVDYAGLAYQVPEQRQRCLDAVDHISS